MEAAKQKIDWWCIVSIRICHATLDPAKISELLNSTPQVARRPGESKIPHGDCRSAGYWCLDYRVDAPERPDVSIAWAENFIKSRESQFGHLVEQSFDIDVYAGIFSNVLALGLVVPPTPTIWKLRIPLGLEFFSQ